MPMGIAIVVAANLAGRLILATLLATGSGIGSYRSAFLVAAGFSVLGAVTAHFGIPTPAPGGEPTHVPADA